MVAAVGFAFVAGMIATLEIFRLHPQFSAGHFHFYWSGFREMKFESSTMTVPLTNGKKETQTDYHIGPLITAIFHES